MLERRLPTRNSLEALLALRVAPSQRGLVAEPAQTLAQAQFETGSVVWGLWEGDKAVGLMAMVDPRAYPFLEPEDDPGAAYLWRLLVDAAHQGRGHGRQALDLAVAQTRDWGLNRLMAGVVNRADSALVFYTAYGFRPTGRMPHGEVEIVLNLG
jgi:diamine N-acetyltransferase